MSTLSVGTIKSATSTYPVFQNSSGTEIGQLAFAWANIETSGSSSIADSFNVSSVTEQNTDHFSLAFANAAGNANWATNVHTTSGFDLRTDNHLSDENFSFIVFGDS